MKTLLTTLFLLIAAISSQAAMTGVQWKCDTNNVTKFTIYRIVNGVRVKLVDVPASQRSAYINNLPTYSWIYLHITAWNGTLESPLSNRISIYIRSY